jgi:hypothetical protein
MSEKSKPSAQYTDISTEESWELIKALRGGTKGMRDAGETVLPKNIHESPEAWSQRRDMSFLFNMYGDTVGKVVSKPMEKPVTVTDEEIVPVNDVDGNQTYLSDKVAESMLDGIHYGVDYMLVDYSTVLKAETKADEAGARPYLYHIPAPNLIGWTFDGTKLVEIRVLECRYDANGKYYYVRTLTPTTWTLHRVEDGKDIFVDGGVNSMGEIPLVEMYYGRVDRMHGRPCLKDLAWLNLQHWQSASDQSNCLHYARFVMLGGKGIPEDQIKAGLTVGPTRNLLYTNPDALLYYIEHSGAAIGAGRTDLQDIQERGVILGLQPFIQKPGGTTATETAVNESRSQSDIHRWVGVAERGFTKAYEYAYKWRGLELPGDFKLNIFDDFSIGTGSKDIDQLIQMRLAKEITREAFLTEVKRRGLLSELFDVEAEADAAENEGPVLSTIEETPEERKERVRQAMIKAKNDNGK